jgi:hypothetical protein
MANGTWDTMFAEGFNPSPGTREAYAMIGIKHELVYCGVRQGGMELDNPEFGGGTTRAVKDFQRANPRDGLDVDGVVGPHTAHVLFRKRALDVEKKYLIQPTLLCKMRTLESADDPACLSQDGNDRGLMQINRPAHPSVLDEMAYNPAYSIDWAGRYVITAYNMFLKDHPDYSRPALWDMACASYNVGTGGARRWDALGRPPSSTASTYVRVVRSRTC